MITPRAASMKQAPSVLTVAAVSLLWMTACLCRAEPTGFIVYYPGDMNVILAAPHGGSEAPDSIQDRTAGCYVNDECIWRQDCGTRNFDKCKATTVKDSFTLELSLSLREALHHLTARRPHLVINLLKRTKLDANRDRDQAAFGDLTAEKAWDEFHQHIDESKKMFDGPGIFFDMHGHGRPEQWAMLGYLFRGPDLNAGGLSPSNSSIRSLAESTDVTFEELVRGNDSLGAYLDENGFHAVPSPKYPGPGNATFYRGGYNTRRHGSRDGGTVDAIQIESVYSFRSPASRRDQYANALARSITKYLNKYYGYSVPEPVKSAAFTRTSQDFGLVVYLLMAAVAMALHGGTL